MGMAEAIPYIIQAGVVTAKAFVAEKYHNRTILTKARQGDILLNMRTALLDWAKAGP